MTDEDIKIKELAYEALTDNRFNLPYQSGWYCPRCDTFHPRNMSCGPEHLVWDKKEKDYIGVGQKLSYFQ